MDLVARAKGILLSPRNEWAKIDGEPATTGSLLVDYAAPLAAIPAIAGFVGTSLLGYNVLGLSYRVPIVRGLVAAIVQYVLTLVGVFVLGLIVDALAPSFGGTRSQIQALKVSVYSSTAAWIAGVFMLVPALSPLSIVGLYSLYLLYLGLPILMKAPADRAIGYTVVSIIAAIVVYAVIGVIAGTVTGYRPWAL